MDFKSLTGDTSDNIKGAEKIGFKTAARLINQFDNLFEIVRRVDEIDQPSVRVSIQKNSQRLLQNYQLIKLDGEVDLPFELDELEYGYNGITTNEVLQGIDLK